MEVESIDEILKRRKEIEIELLDMLKETESDFNLQQIKDMIYNEEDQDDLMQIVAMFDRGGDASEFENILELVNDAWNYFPHKCLGGVSPMEKTLEYQNKSKNRKFENKSKKQKLTKKQIDLLWSSGGEPYSQVRMSKEVRILGNEVSRIFWIVEVEINPTTFELVKKNRNIDYFKNDIAIQQLIDHSQYRGPEFGYVSMAYEKQYLDEVAQMEAELALQRSRDILIKMHNFIMENYNF